MNAEKKKFDFNFVKKSYAQSEYFYFPNNYMEEGQDHINLNIQSETRVGKIFDPAYIKTIQYPYIGKFGSVANLWYWLKSDNLDDRLRRIPPRDLKNPFKFNKNARNYVNNFRAVIGYATWLKIKSTPVVIKDIKELPDDIVLLSYNVIKSSGVRICTNYAYLIISIANIIIKAVKEDTEPNFDSLVDHGSSSELFYIDDFLKSFLTEEKYAELLKRGKYQPDDLQLDFLPSEFDE